MFKTNKMAGGGGMAKWLGGKPSISGHIMISSVLLNIMWKITSLIITKGFLHTMPS